MADLQPLSGLRYRVARESAGAVLAPPYDVISPAQQERLYESSPYNVIRLEYPRETGERRYAAAAEALNDWRGRGVLAVEERPALYLYEQIFEHGGHAYHRRAVIGRVRLAPLDSGEIRPHEYTMSGPKEDRFALLSATRTNISPIYSLVDDEDGAFGAALARIDAPPVLDATDFSGQRHRHTLIEDPAVIGAHAAAEPHRPQFIADGHHRYETALRYQGERRSAAQSWSGEEAENFVLMAITATNDPGLLILPIHRLVHPRRRPADLPAALTDLFDVRDLGRLDDPSIGGIMVAALAEAGARTNAFALAEHGRERVHLLTLRDRARAEAAMPPGHPAAWRALDVNVLQFGVLEPLLGMDAEALAAGEIEFSEDVGETLAAVREGRAPLAFLVNATSPADIIAVAGAGDRMPQKSTYIYPKRGTGLVMYAQDVS
jgi:uncharacterized protein (DUF1015 family)